MALYEEVKAFEFERLSVPSRTWCGTMMIEEARMKAEGPPAMVTRKNGSRIQIIVALLILAVVITLVFVLPYQSDAPHCQENLKSLGTTLQLHFARFNAYPKTRSGIRFLVAPLNTGTVPFTADSIRCLYICKTDDCATRAGRNPLKAYRNLDNLDPAMISYAGRNTVDYPLDPGNARNEPIACDAGGINGDIVTHGHVVHVLFLDGHVEEVDVTDYLDSDGKLEVGPSSPVPLLRKLNKDP